MSLSLRKNLHPYSLLILASLGSHHTYNNITTSTQLLSRMEHVAVSYLFLLLFAIELHPPNRYIGVLTHSSIEYDVMWERFIADIITSDSS